MSLLVTIDTDPDFAPKEALPAPERRISGNPSFKTWAQDASRQDKVLTGVWEATPGETHSIKGTTYEFCHLISARLWPFMLDSRAPLSFVSEHRFGILSCWRAGVTHWKLRRPRASVGRPPEHR
jgi:hypothetical protein